MIIGIVFIVLIILVLALMLTSYDAGKKYAEQKLIHVIKMLERSPSPIIFKEDVLADTVWYKCLEIVTDEFNRLSDL